MMSRAADKNKPAPVGQAEGIPGRHALRALNFFMADMQSGIGPFIGVFLLAHGWQSGWIGSVMTIGSIAGVTVTAPAGAWVDSSRHKRWLVVIPGFCSIAASLVAMRMSASRGLWLVLFISFLTLPVRGLIAATVIKAWGVFPVQILDGIGAGLPSVAVPALVAHVLNGTGRINVGQGAAMTVQGAGAALSPAIGGWIAQWQGYRAAFIALGLFAVGAIVVWLTFAELYKPAIAQASRVKPLARPKAHRVT